MIQGGLDHHAAGLIVLELRTATIMESVYFQKVRLLANKSRLFKKLELLKE